jgi:hypothetical protein
MTSRINTITIDAADPRVLANFWSKLLDYRVTYDSSDQVIIEAHDEAGPGGVVHRDPGHKEGKNRVHLDLTPTTSRLRSSARWVWGRGQSISARMPAPTRPGRCSPTPRATSSAS